MTVDLVEQRKLVLEIIQSHLDKNKPFKMKKILSLIHARFKLMDININQNGIEIILKTLIKKNCIIEGSIISRDNLLNNDKRKIIYEYIRDNPGTFFNDMKRSLDICTQVLIWHLKMSEKYKIIKKKILENHVIYYCSDIRYSKAEQSHYLRRSIDIINFLKSNNKGCSKTKLADNLNMHYNTLKKYIDKLEKYSLLIKKQNSRNLNYFLNSDMYEKLKYEFNL